jgi:hypothetical protein
MNIISYKLILFYLILSLHFSFPLTFAQDKKFNLNDFVPSATESRLDPNEKIDFAGRIFLPEYLGEGAAGRTYKLIDPKNPSDIQFIVKKLFKGTLSAQEYEKEKLLEVKKHQLLEILSVPTSKVYEILDNDLIVKEFIDGPTLSQFVSQLKVPAKNESNEYDFNDIDKSQHYILNELMTLVEKHIESGKNITDSIENPTNILFDQKKGIWVVVDYEDSIDYNNLNKKKAKAKSRERPPIEEFYFLKLSRDYLFIFDKEVSVEQADFFSEFVIHYYQKIFLPKLQAKKLQPQTQPQCRGIFDFNSMNTFHQFFQIKELVRSRYNLPIERDSQYLPLLEYCEH